MLKDYFGIGRGSGSTIPPRFLALFVIVFIPMTALWFFYRWIFNDSASIFAMLVISLGTSWIIAYLIGYGKDTHTRD